MPCWRSSLLFVIEWGILLIFLYFFFLIIQLALFNLVIVGIIWVLISKIYQFLEAFKEKNKFYYRTFDFNTYVD